MAEASISWAQDQFRCSVCWDLLKDPVTVPCGHTYCMRCITDCWDQEDLRGIYRCPQCRENFSPRPVLGKNVVVAEMVEKLKKTRIEVSGDVKCDVCTGRKLKAIKSCLMCLNSYCQTHLDQHENFFRGKRHNLVEATGQLQEMICSRHDKMIDMYCRTDQRCICMLCMVDEHRNHDTVSISTASAEKQVRSKETQNEVNQKIQEREKDLQKLRETVDSYKRSAQTAVEDCEMMFTQLISEVTQLIRDQEKTAVSRAEGLLEGLKREIEDLKRKDAEIKTLSQTQDHFQFLQSLSLSGSTENFNITPDVSFDAVMKSITQYREKLQRFCREEMKKISDRLIAEPRNRREFLQCFHQFTLDPNTANYGIKLSEWNKAGTLVTSRQPYVDHPDRFDRWTQVFCTEGVNGRCYWEVEWTGQGKLGVDIAVAYKSMSRKGIGLDSAVGRNDQSWNLFCSPSYYSFMHNNMETIISINPTISRIGVYVDHSAGILSFYSVSDTMTLIHRVQTTFTQPLYPMFGLDERTAFRLSSNINNDIEILQIAFFSY
ncbi:tripartite motif-containing protein 16-like [Paramisgurnus dabryanus]|uniref:tripartite motif-containing protein 16-like n=1 Tax=Paramisgurnus dabryanus TaxID=90735 RepID=UPI003CCFC741